MRDSMGAGTAAVTLAWSAPIVRSVRPAQSAGSPAPGAEAQGFDPEGGATATPTGGLSTGDPAGALGGTLPVTGIEVLPMVATGAGAVVAGHALMGAQRRRPEHDEDLLDHDEDRGEPAGQGDETSADA